MENTTPTQHTTPEKTKKPAHTDIRIHLIYICLIALMLVLIFVIAGTKPTVTDSGNTVWTVSFDYVSTVAVSVICSVLASVLISLFMERDEEKKKHAFLDGFKGITDEIYNQKIGDAIDRTAEQVSQIYQNAMGMAPEKLYEATAAPNPLFNMELDRSILGSDSFSYYGESARYTCLRLMQLAEKSDLHHLHVKVFMPNPSRDGLYEDNIRFLMAKEQNRNAGNTSAGMTDEEQIIRDSRKKAVICLYILYTLRTRFASVDVYLLDEIPAISIEQTDSKIYLEFYRTRSAIKRYPLTIAYGRDNAYYEAYKIYFEWIMSRGGTLGKNMSQIDEKYILDLAKRAGLGDLTVEDLKAGIRELGR